MALLPVPNDPTWAEIQAGMTAAAADGKTARDAARVAQAAAKQKRAEAAAHAEDMRSAERNYAQWEAAVRRKLFRAAP